MAVQMLGLWHNILLKGQIILYILILFEVCAHTDEGFGENRHSLNTCYDCNICYLHASMALCRHHEMPAYTST